MCKSRPIWSLVLLLGLVVLAGAQDKPAEPLDRKALDGHVYAVLKDVINSGADLYNARDYAGCFHVYKTALVVLRPLLDHRPELQKAISAALAEAEREPDVAKRAWVLRKMLDALRAAANPKAGAAKIDDKKVEVKKEEAKKDSTLWERLGGEPTVKKVVDDWFELASANPKVDLTRGNLFAPTPDQVIEIKRKAVGQFSSLTGGPLKYDGRSMKEIHKNMKVKDSEFTAVVDDLRKALAANGVKLDDVLALIKIVEATRKDIVEEKK